MEPREARGPPAVEVPGWSVITWDLCEQDPVGNIGPCFAEFRRSNFVFGNLEASPSWGGRFLGPLRTTHGGSSLKAGKVQQCLRALAVALTHLA